MVCVSATLFGVLLWLSGRCLGGGDNYKLFIVGMEVLQGFSLLYLAGVVRKGEIACYQLGTW